MTVGCCVLTSYNLLLTLMYVHLPNTYESRIFKFVCREYMHIRFQKLWRISEIGKLYRGCISEVSLYMNMYIAVLL